MSSPVRVLHVVPWFTSGGVERRRLTLAKGLKRSEFEQSVVCLETRGPLRDEIESHGVPVIAIGGSWAIWDARSIAATARVIREFSPDIVHGAVFEGVSMASLASLVSPSAQLVLEEIAFPSERSWRGRALFRLLARRAACCVAVSEAVGVYLREHSGVPARKVRVIPNGVDLPSEPEASTLLQLRAHLALPKDAIVVGSVGRMHDHVKRFSDLLRAVQIVGDELPMLRLLLVGDGPDRSALERLATELGLRDRVIFAGFQPDVAPFYRLMDVFALVSQHESFGLALVEAMLARLPTVCTDVGGMRDVVLHERTGLRVPVGDVAAIAEALRRLLGDRARRLALGTAGRDRALHHFSAERYVNDVRALYLELVRGR